MYKLPESDGTTPYISLSDFFKSITREVMLLDGLDRQKLVRKYQEYVEKEAQKTKSAVLRAQLRINLASFGEQFSTTPLHKGINVRPKKSCRMEFPEFGFLEVSMDDLGQGIHIFEHD